MANLYDVSSTPTSVTFSVGYIPGYTYYRLFIRLSSQTQVLDTINIQNVSADFEYTVSGLTPNTSYTCNVGYFPGDPTTEKITYMGAQEITTKTFPNFVLGRTSNSVTAYVTPGNGYTYYELELRDTSGNIKTTAFDYKVSAFTYTFTGLLPSTTYYVQLLYGSDKEDTGVEFTAGWQMAITDAPPEPTRPSNWSWQNIAAGVSVPKSGEALAPTTAAEWNSFCSRINAFRQYKDMSNYSFTSLTSGTAFSSAIARQAMTAISEISGHGTLPDKIEPLKAAFWLSLASSLNAVS